MKFSRPVKVPVISGYHSGTLTARIITGSKHCSGWWWVTYPQGYTGFFTTECFRTKAEVRKFIKTFRKPPKGTTKC